MLVKLNIHLSKRLESVIKRSQYGFVRDGRIFSGHKVWATLLAVQA